MNAFIGFIATLILIALGVVQNRARTESKLRDFAIVAIIATLIAIYSV